MEELEQCIWKQVYQKEYCHFSFCRKLPTQAKQNKSSQKKKACCIYQAAEVSSCCFLWYGNVILQSPVKNLAA